MADKAITVAITDYAFEDDSVERGILEPLGCRVISQKEYTNEENLISLLRGVDYVVTLYAPITENVINSLTQCKAICRYGIGVDNIDINAAAKKNIPACNNPDYCIDEVADHNLALILCLARDVQKVALETKKGVAPSDADKYKLKVMKEIVIGLIGFGKIGREVANRLKPFKCRVKVFDPVVSDVQISESGFEPGGLDDVLSESDLIALQCPCNDKTHHLINTDSIAKMKRGVLFVNAARGGLVDTDALVDALKDGHVAAAALDTVEDEPLATDSPLFQMDNVIVTNHIAYASEQAKYNLRAGALKPIISSIKSGKVCNVVNGVYTE